MGHFHLAIQGYKVSNAFGILVIESSQAWIIGRVVLTGRLDRYL